MVDGYNYETGKPNKSGWGLSFERERRINKLMDYAHTFPINDKRRAAIMEHAERLLYCDEDH